MVILKEVTKVHTTAETMMTMTVSAMASTILNQATTNTNDAVVTTIVAVEVMVATKCAAITMAITVVEEVTTPIVRATPTTTMALVDTAMKESEAVIITETTGGMTDTKEMTETAIEATGIETSVTTETIVIEGKTTTKTTVETVVGMEAGPTGMTGAVGGVIINTPDRTPSTQVSRAHPTTTTITTGVAVAGEVEMTEEAVTSTVREEDHTMGAATMRRLVAMVIKRLNEDEPPKLSITWLPSTTSPSQSPATTSFPKEGKGTRAMLLIC